MLKIDKGTECDDLKIKHQAIQADYAAPNESEFKQFKEV